MPAVSGALTGERAAIFNGQWWRLWSAHLAHHNTEHLLWNLVVFAVVGLWLECIAPRATRLFLGTAPVIISGALLVLLPRLEVYAGLSGLAAGQLVLLSLVRLHGNGREPRWLWWCVLGLVAAKIGLESWIGDTLFVRADGAFRPVPLAHLAGAGCACAVFYLCRLRGRS